MKKVIFSLIIVLGAIQAMAQRPHHHRGGMMDIDKIKEVVELTADQEERLTVLFDQMKESRKSESFKNLTPEERKAQMKDHRVKMKEILTEDQLNQLKAARKEHRETMKAFHKEVKAYREKNVEPVLREKRAVLEAELTEDEKATIVKVKEELKAIRSEHKGKGKRIKGDQQGRHMKSPEHREKMKALMAQLKPIAEAHKETLDRIDVELQPLRLQWETDIKAIRAKYDLPEHDKNRKKHDCEGEDCKHKKGERGKGQGQKLHFLLMES